MKMVVVGGNGKDIGKTSVIVGLIRALSRYPWTAIKLTRYGEHSLASAGDKPDNPPDDPFVIHEETERDGKTDTSRFLAAGARRALWVRVRPGALREAIPALRRIIAHDEYVIVESNSILQFYEPDIYLSLLDPAREDFKPSAQALLNRADVCLVLEPGLKNARWEETVADVLRDKPVFSIGRDFSLAPEIVALVEGRLQGPGKLPSASGNLGGS